MGGRPGIRRYRFRGTSSRILRGTKPAFSVALREMNRTLGSGMDSTCVKEVTWKWIDYLLSCSVGRVRAGCGFQISGVGSEILEPFWRKEREDGISKRNK